MRFICNFIAKIGKKNIKNYLELLKDIFEAPDIKSARERRDRLVSELELKKPSVAEWLDEEIEFCFTVDSLPKEHRK
ncbi:transposase [Calditrichota bacterium LG25]